MKKLIMLAMALVLCLSFAMSAQAAFIIDFEISPDQTGSSLSFTGNNIIGNLNIDRIIGLNTPAKSGLANALVSTNGIWNFTTPKVNPAIIPDHLLFNQDVGTSSLNISGDFKNGGTTVSDPVQLIQGSWTSAEVHKIVDTPNGYAFTCVFDDVKSQALLDYFGITGSGNMRTVLVTFGFTLPNGTVLTDPWTASTISSGDIQQAPGAPIPGSVLLLGSGLLGLTGIGIRRKKI